MPSSELAFFFFWLKDKHLTQNYENERERKRVNMLLLVDDVFFFLISFFYFIRTIRASKGGVEEVAGDGELRGWNPSRAVRTGLGRTVGWLCSG